MLHSEPTYASHDWCEMVPAKSVKLPSQLCSRAEPFAGSAGVGLFHADTARCLPCRQHTFLCLKTMPAWCMGFRVTLRLFWYPVGLLTGTGKSKCFAHKLKSSEEALAYKYAITAVNPIASKQHAGLARSWYYSCCYSCSHYHSQQMRVS